MQPQGNVDPYFVAASVEIRRDMFKGYNQGTGTCILVDETTTGGQYALILTNKHVTPNGDARITVVWPSGQTQLAAFVAAHTEADLACIVVTADGHTPSVPIAQSHPVKGDPVCQVGYPRGRMMKRTGQVVGYIPTTGVRLFVPSFAVDNGDSGSGIFLLRERALCGVVWGTGDGQTVGVEWKVCKSFVEERCCFWRRRPQQPQPQQPLPPVPPPAPPNPPPPPLVIAPMLPGAATAHARIAALEKQLADLAAQLHGLHGQVQTNGSAIQGLPVKLGELDAKVKADLAALQGVQGQHANVLGSLQDKIKNLPDLAALDAKLQGIGGKLAGMPALTPEKLAAIEGAIGKVEAVAGKVAGLETGAGAGALAGWAPYLPWIAAGGATGGLSLLLPLAAGAFGLVRSLIAKNQGGTPGGGSITPAPAPPQVPLAPSPTVVAPYPPTSPTSRTVPEFVPTTVTDPWAESLTEALKKVETQKLSKTPGEIIALAQELFAGRTGKAKAL